ncbi:DUF1287 domain-containing protein [Pseudoalteromonas sp. CR1]|uniref:DUF1287 domain-containing protein n=1 Tax=Pseudoalteromonas sp. CR1 TaxID=2861964 RepID=UPI001C5FDF6A|nr:DUF1287 domain-containing protein [Pseudoalteromonas sp. CR1]MBW4967680.1 DUF1287 domain-containing protein [Pseudoalteromonas sp. CR1]
MFKHGLYLFTFLPFFTLANSFNQQITAALIERTTHNITYDGSYHSIKYPGGDVPSNIGVCTDVIIRAYRQLGVDLQQRVHEDIRANFARYPSQRIWGLKKPDKNIDHRRVPNLQVFFKHNGIELAISRNSRDYKVGDIVTWKLPGNLPHIGMVVTEASNSGKKAQIVHNIGRGPELSEMLFDYKITGHYRFTNKHYNDQ